MKINQFENGDRVQIVSKFQSNYETRFKQIF